MLADRAEAAAWLRLLETPEVGRDAARRLLAAFGAPEAVFEAAPAALRQVAGARLASALASEPPLLAARQRSLDAWLDGGPRRGIVALGDEHYPPQLLQTADPPLLLYVDGDPALLALPAMAIVGSRSPTAQGADNARAFAAALGRAGFAIVSGLALGIDGAAHEGALGAGAATIGVVGNGPDIAYPPRHRALTQRIVEQGLLVSEYAPGTPPLPENFPQRNRIIAGLARGTLVVEAALRSGSLITARQAAEAGREVFAIPGSIHSPQSRGCHALIRQGAKLVETAADILEELGPTARAAPRDDDTAARGVDPVLDALGHDPVTLDTLGARTGWPTRELSARLLELELGGQVARLPGGLYQRRAVA